MRTELGGRQPESPRQPEEAPKFFVELLDEVQVGERKELLELSQHVVEMCQSLGKQEAQRVLTTVFSFTSRGRKSEKFYKYYLKNFTEEGYKSAQSLFGKDRVAAAIAENKIDLFGFSEEEWIALAEVIDDSPPYDTTWELVSGSYWPRSWVGGVERIKSIKDQLSGEEFKTLFAAGKTKQVLVRGKHGGDWPLDFAATGRMPFAGWDATPTTPESIKQLKGIFGDSFKVFLGLDLDPREVEKMTPDKLENAQAVIPDLSQRLVGILSASNGKEELTHFALFLRWRLKDYTKIATPLTPEQQSALADRPFEELNEFVEWMDKSGTSRDIWKILCRSVSEDYLTQMLGEARLFSINGKYLNELFYEMEVDPHDFYKNQFQRREQIDATLQAGEHTSKLLAVHPSVAPYLRLRFDRLSETVDDEQTMAEVEQWAKKMLARAEGSRFDPRYVPSEGVEIEILKERKIDIWDERDVRVVGEEVIQEATPINHKAKHDFVKTMIFGIQRGTDEAWEFALDPSEAFMQARFVSELIAGNWIDKEYMEDGNYTLHVNIGVPEGALIAQDSEELQLLVSSITTAFAEKERLLHGGYKYIYKLKTQSSFQRDDKNQSRSVDNQPYSGRLEIRTLSVDHKTIYQLLLDAPVLSAAFFASLREDKDEVDAQLTNIWQAFAESAQTIAEQHGVKWNTDEVKEGLEDHVDAVMNAQTQMKELVEQTTWKIRQLV